MTKKWPRWMEIFYYEKMSGRILKYLGCMNNSEMILEVIYRLGITEQMVMQWKVDENLISKEEVSQIFNLYEKHRREIEEKYEKR